MNDQPEEMALPEQSDVSDKSDLTDLVDLNDMSEHSGKSPITMAIGGAALYLVFFLGMTLFNAHSPQLPRLVWALLAPLTVVAYLLILVMAIRLLCHLTLTARQETLLAIISLFCFTALNPYVRYAAGQILHGKSLMAAIGTLSNVKSNAALDIVVPFLLILTGVFFGQLLARVARERAILVPVAFCCALVDFWGVYWGPVSAATEKASAAVSTMAAAATASAAVPEAVKASLPPQLAIFGNIAPPQNIGIGDFVFLAFFLTCAYRLGFSARRTMWGIFAGLLLASVILAFNGQTLFGFHIAIDYLPGLLFISGGMLLANVCVWKLTRQEWMMTGVMSLLLLGLIASSAIPAILKSRAALRNAPKVFALQYSLPVLTPDTAIREALRRLPKGKIGSTILPIDVECRYALRDGKFVPIRWGMLAVQQPPRGQEATAQDYLVRAQLNTKKKLWMVEETTTQPAQSAPSFLLMQLPRAQRPKADLPMLLHSAKPLPKNTYDVLKKPLRNTKTTMKHPSCLLDISAGGIVLIDENGKMLEKPYKP